jgi:hypothetical protein
MTESGTSRRAGRRRPRGEQPIVSPAQFTSCYGKPVLNAPVWEPRDIAGYLFLGGLASASSLLDGPRVRQHARVFKERGPANLARRLCAPPGWADCFF